MQILLFPKSRVSLVTEPESDGAFFDFQKNTVIALW